MVRAADGAMWIGDFGCDRLLRVTPERTTAMRVPRVTFAALAADASGGVWFSRDGGVGHVDAAGAVRSFALPLGSPSAIAAGADGTPGSRTVRAASRASIPAARVTTAAAPVPAYELAFDASGRLLLASRTRLVRFTPGAAAGPCGDGGRSQAAGAARRAADLAGRAAPRLPHLGRRARALVGVVAEHLRRAEP